MAKKLPAKATILAKPESGRADASVIEARIKEITRRKLRGHTRYKLLELATEWGVTEHRMDQLIAVANRRIIEASKTDIEEDVGTIVNNLWDLYERADIEGDRAEMHKIMATLSKIKGLDKIQISIKDDRNLNNIEESQLDGVIEDSRTGEEI